MVTVVNAAGVRDSLLVQMKAPDIAKYKNQVNLHLYAMLRTSAQQLGLDESKMGAHLFLKRGALFWSRLVNAGRFRKTDRPAMFNPRWRPGKGIIGMAFDREEFILRDCGSWADSESASGKTRWEKLSFAQRQGLNWGELQQSRAYSAVAALPLYDSRGSAVGVIALDGPSDLLAYPDIIELTMRSAADRMAMLHPPPSGWWITN